MHSKWCYKIFNLLGHLRETWGFSKLQGLQCYFPQNFKMQLNILRKREVFWFLSPSGLLESFGSRWLSCQSKRPAQAGTDLGEGCRGCAPPSPPWDDLQFSNTTGILPKKKTMRFIGVEVEQGTSAPPPKKILEPPPARDILFKKRHP